MKVLLNPKEGFYEEKKSRFIASVCSVSSEEEAYAFIDKIKKQYWDARHNCSAFVLGANAEITRCNDDGEPSQTAGKPMLEVLLHSEVRNVVVVVTRYFGGTLLGTGGLIRAYQSAVKDAIENSEIGEEVSGIRATVKADYTLVGKLEFFFREKNIVVTDTQYSDVVRMTFRTRNEKFAQIENELINITCGKVEIEDKKECIFIATANE